MLDRARLYVIRSNRFEYWYVDTLFAFSLLCDLHYHMGEFVVLECNADYFRAPFYTVFFELEW